MTRVPKPSASATSSSAPSTSSSGCSARATWRKSSLDAAGIDRHALATVLENGQKRVRVRSDAPQAEGVPLSSHARRLLEAGTVGEGPIEANVLFAALTDRRGALTRFLSDKGIPAEVVLAEVAARSGISAPVMPPAPPPREPRPPREERQDKPERQEKASRPERQEKASRPEKSAREKQERPTRQERQEKLHQERMERQERRAKTPREVVPEPVVERRPPSVGKLAPKPKPKVSWFRMLLLLAVPAAIVLNYMHASAILVFVAACLGVLPLAGFMGEATEQIAARTGPTIGGLLNATFGNAAELIIAIVALQAGPGRPGEGVDHRQHPRQPAADPRPVDRGRWAQAIGAQVQPHERRA